MTNDANDISTEDIRAAARWYGLTLPLDRAEAIAVELSGLNAALGTAARRLRYDDEPGAFEAALRDARGPAGRD